MTKSKTTRRAFWVSCLSLMLCVAFLAASTLAWFTDTAATGKNRIKSGNLDIEMQYWNGSEYKEMGDEPLFGDEIEWEPGMVVYKQLKISNMGSLAAKFSVDIDWDSFKSNYVLEPNTGKNSDVRPYLGTYRTLSDVIQVVVYPGTFDELVSEVNGSDGSYEKTDRGVIDAAIEKGILDATDDNLYTFFQPIGPTDVGAGSLFVSALAPKGQKSKSITFKRDESYDSETVVADDSEEFTFIAYWMPDKGIWEGEFFDDDYNLKNGRKASVSTNEDDLYNFDTSQAKKLKANAASENGLYIDFDIMVHATQVPFESDSFGNDYDDNANFGGNAPALPPEFEP